MTTRTPPGFDTAGKRIWRAVVGTYELSDAELETLRVAALAADRLEIAQAMLKSEGAVVTNRFGAMVPHPASKLAHDAGATINSCMRLLALPDEEAAAAPTRAKPGPRPGKGTERRLRQVH